MDVVERFEEVASECAAHDAVVDRGDRITYRELDVRANRLANVLREHGIRTESVVGVCAGRGHEAITATLAVLKTGGAFLPMDAGHPAARRQQMLRVADAHLLVTCRDLGAPAVPDGVEVLFWEDLGIELTAGPATAPERFLPPGSLRCVIFTSGSTGEPKGIGLCSRSLENVVDWALSKDRAPRNWLQFTSLGFDMSLQEIFGALLSGGRLVLVPEWQRQDPAELAKLVASEDVQRVHLSPGLLRQLARTLVPTGGARPIPFTEVVSAGEALRLDPDIRALFRECGATLENQYGPSETHQATAFTMTGDPARWPGRPPLGHAIPGVRLHLLDTRLAPVPPGAEGEVYIAGAGVARGYLGRPGLTAQRFLPEPDGPAGSRMYRTGDLARALPTGEVEFLGRADRQVKIRGHRVEPSEVDAVLTTHPAVRDAATVARSRPDGTVALAAYVVAAPGNPFPGQTGLREFVGARLPGYLVPDRVIALPELPLNRNGKVDHTALPEPADVPAERRTPVRLPANPQEQLIFDIWAGVLGPAVLGVDDDFLELGGNSLQAMQIMSRVREVFDVDVAVHTLFEAPTVAQLAVAVEKAIVTELSAGEPSEEE
jgi:amino acid adenylation domain-containing protein